MKNILYLHTHDTGRCIAPYGYALDTPNLMEFAKNATLFRQAFCCGPTCSPSRAALVTGSYPHQCGMLGLAHRGFNLNDKSKHIANYLKSNGYHTALCGVQHESVENFLTHGTWDIDAKEVGELGYEEFSEVPLEITRYERDLQNTLAACDILARKHEKPLFLSLGLANTHRPFPQEPDELDNPNYMLPPMPIPNTPECRKDWSTFAKLVRQIDYCFGLVLQALKDNNLEDDTMVLITTDHGIAFPLMKSNLNDSGCGVMFMLKVPGVDIGNVHDQMITHMDFYPTVCDWANLPKPNWLEGNSLLPLMRGEEYQEQENIFSEITYHAALDVQRSVRTKRFRYVKRYDSYDKTVWSNTDKGITKDYLATNGDFGNRARIPEEQLFDLLYDPCEANSLIGDVRYDTILREMQEALEQWMRKTNDPLLDGIPEPKGLSKIDPQDAFFAK